MKAWQFLERNGWCQHSSAKTKAGRGTVAIDKEAVAFCIIGACAAVYWPDYWHAVERVEHVLGVRPGVWNDVRGRTKQEVVAVMKQADV